MVRPVSFKGFQKGFQGVSLRGFRGFQFFLWELCVCIKYLSLGDSLRGTGDTLPATVRRMTGATADRFMLKDRGCVREGHYADLTVFDEDEIKNAQPDQGKSFGIKRAFINGVPVLKDGALDEEALRTTGMALRV